ncbi:MAG: Ig domain-containing protein [Ruminococcaceae bacterium]|nr:Ig domain-containing protein [Oscillospiraceae bacterium]
MKKTVILILLLLPIVLVITISFAGRILSIYHHIPVEKVFFVDNVGDALDDEYLFVVNVGETKPTSIRIFPEMASNKKVSFVSQNESVCKVDAEGNLSGIAIGNTTVLVTTSESNKTDVLNVLVVAERVTGITLPESKLTMIKGEQKQLQPIIEPYTALNKAVSFESSDPTVISVNPNGYITALKPGEAIITVTTQDGGMNATCKISVTEGLLHLSFDMTGAPNVSPAASGSGYVINSASIDLSPYLKYDDKIEPEAIRWRIASGNNSATLTDTVLTFTSTKISVVVIHVYVGELDNPTYETKLTLFYQP